MPDDTFDWLETDYIGELLHEHYADRDPMRIGFVELKKLVMALPGFKERPGHVVNEKILEHIQAAWIEQRQGGRKSEDEE